MGNICYNSFATIETASSTGDNYFYINGSSRSGGIAATGAGITMASQSDLYFRPGVTWNGNWTTTGRAAMTILSASGNVGIGTVAPTATLTVAGTASISGQTFFGGNVGIGTTTPLSKLDVNGEIRTRGATDGYVGFQAAASTSSTTYTWPTSAGTNGYVLTTDGTGTLTWAAQTGGGSGAVSSVNSQTGTVTLTTTHIAEGTNEYFTTARAQSALTASLATKEPTLAAATTADYYRGDKSWQTLTSAIVPELTNLYFTNDRVLTATISAPTLTNSAIATGDTVLVALGKLQAQTSSVSSTKADLTNVAQTITAAAVTGLTAPVAGSDAANKQYVDSAVTGSNSWTASGSDVYRLTGNVGIGTATPSSLLHLRKDFAGEAVVMNLQNDSPAGAGVGPGMQFLGQNGSGTSSVTMGKISASWSGANDNGNLDFYTRSAGTVGKRMTILYDGKTVIGTTPGSGQSGTSQLSVEVKSTTGNTSTDGITIRHADSNGAGSNGIGTRIKFMGESTNSDTYPETGVIESVLDAAADNAKNSSMRFYTLGPNATTGSDVATEKMRLDASGNLGIGTTSPSYKLDVSGSLNATSLYVGGVAFNPSSTASSVATGGGQVNVFTQIATDAATASRSALVLENDGTGGAYEYNLIGKNAAGTMTSYISQAGDASFASSVISPNIYGSSVASATLTIDSTSNGTKGSILLAPSGGNVGIGTSVPSGTLEVSGVNDVGSVASVITNRSQLNTGKTVELAFRVADSVGTKKTTAMIRSIPGNIDSTTGAHLAFFTRKNDVSPTESMRIDNNGNVGIGITAPTASLTVAGTASISGQIIVPDTIAPAYSFSSSTNTGMRSAAAADLRLTSNGNDRFRIAGGIVYTSAKLNVGDLATVPASTLGVIGNASIGSSYMAVNAPTNGLIVQGDVGVGTASPSSRLTVTGSTTTSAASALDVTNSSATSILYVRNDGRVGIGTTGPTVPLEVVGNIRTYYPGTGDLTISHFGLVSAVKAASGIQLSLGANGTEKMRIDTGGNVGIGTTAPLSTLDVNGEIRTRGSSNGYVGFAATASTSSTTYTWPAADGAASGYVLKTDGAGTLTWGAPFSGLASSDVTTALGYTPINKAGDTLTGTLTLAAGSFTIGPSGFLIVPNPVLMTDAANKQYVDSVVSSAGGWTASGTDIYRASGKVGVGTSTASFALSVGDGSSNDGAIMARGYGVVGTDGATLTISGAGTRMFWYPKKAAFRAGGIDGTQWNDANIGNYSVAIGKDNKASGANSFAMGLSNTVAGYNAVAMGNGNIASDTESLAMMRQCTASGQWSMAIGYINLASGAHASSVGGWGNIASGPQATAVGGYGNIASGDEAFATGYTNFATGDRSAAFGYATTASAYAHFTIGRYNVGGGTKASWVATDPLFEIGNGSSSAARSSAMMVLKNGNVGIGTASPSYPLEINGNAKATAFITTSDQRLKKEIKPVEGLAAVNQLNGVSFKWIKDGMDDMGVIAQDVEKVFPASVATDKAGMKAVKYNSLFAPIIEAIKELYRDFKALVARVANLESKESEQEKEIAKIKAENAALKAYICSKDKKAAFCR